MRSRRVAPAGTVTVAGGVAAGKEEQQQTRGGWSDQRRASRASTRLFFGHQTIVVTTAGHSQADRACRAFEMSCVGSSLVALTAAAGVARRSCKHIHHPGVASWASFAATQRHTSDSKSRKELQRHAGTLTRPEASKDQRGSLASQLAKAHRLPLFTVPSEQLKLIEHPKDFYGELLSMISRAKRRIFLASLYIGKSENELVSGQRPTRSL